MLDPYNSDHIRFKQALNKAQFQTKINLTFEYFMGAFWPCFVWIGFFITLSIWNIPSVFGHYGPSIAWITFVIGFIFLWHDNAKNFSNPTLQDIYRRLEHNNKLTGRPLSTFQDGLANPGKNITEDLWQQLQQTLFQTLSNLKPGKIQPILAQKDHYALRFAVLLLCFLGGIFAGDQWQNRVFTALLPFKTDIQHKTIAGVTVQIIPPNYTGQGTTTLSGISHDDPLSLPTGSIIKARVHDGFGTPELIMGDITIPLEQQSDHNFAYEGDLLKGNDLKIRQSFITRFKWPYQLVSDTAPTIIVSSEVDTLPRGEQRFSIQLSDDYGVRDIKMNLSLDPIITEAPLGEKQEDIRAVMTPAKEEVEIQPVYDLTAHPWAGLPVVIEFTAIDDLGQETLSDPLHIVLHERIFHHPIAKKLIKLRKKLAWDPEISAPDTVQELDHILDHPDDYENDKLVFLGLQAASSRLIHSPGIETGKALIDLFWNLAIHLEDGDINIAMRNLRDAQRALENALNDPNLSDEELSELILDLQQAMQDYFRELQRDLQKRMAEGENFSIFPEDQLSQMVNPEDFQQFFDQLESESLSGNPDRARELLSQLGRLMDMMDPALSGQMPFDMQMMAEGINEIQELIEKQQDLLDRTENIAKTMIIDQNYADLIPEENLELDFGDLPPAPQVTPQKPPSKTIDTQLFYAEQETLRYVLGQLMREAGEALPEIPETMGLAEQEMRRSSTQLKDNKPAPSIPHQEKAIEYLREAMKSLSQQMMARMEKMTGMRLGQGRRDPLGRRYGDKEGPSWLPHSQVQIPDESERKKVEEILKILRRRSGEFQRPEEELDYFRRLLKQF